VGVRTLVAVALLLGGLLAATPGASAAPAGELVVTKEPRVVGELRFGRTVRATPGRWKPRPDKVRYQWLRGGEPIAGATKARYEIRPEDVGQGLRVQVRAKATGHAWAEQVSDPRGKVRHRTGVRRTVTYSVETRGRVSGLAEFRRQVQQTYDDPRGWRGAGVAFRPVARGGRFTVVLAEASRVPDFSSICSVEWSCRVGRYVIINQTRWRHASPAWNAARGSLRDYRHMVVNHETGHWLGFGHSSCAGRGRPAPVMMQQSKSLGGCRFNPFPTLAELGRAR
jgi:hypothetical protein